MDITVVFTTFIAVFFAELADKTQLVGLVMSAQSRRPLSVWLGSVVAYMVVTAISVWLGGFLGRNFKIDPLRYLAAFIFIALGVIVLCQRH